MTPFTPSRREAQMIEAIADAVEIVHSQTKNSTKSWSQLMCEHLRSLARGGGEEKPMEYIGKDFVVETNDLLGLQGLNEKKPVQFSPAQVEAIKKNLYAGDLNEFQRWLESHSKE